MIEFTNEGNGITGICVKGKRVGSIWENKDGGATISIQPLYWGSGFSISQEESHLYSYEGTIILRPSKPKANDFEKIESPNPHTDAEWPAHDDYDTYIKKKKAELGE